MPEICANCFAGGIQRVAFYQKEGSWLCSFCYDLSFDDPDDSLCDCECDCADCYEEVNESQILRDTGSIQVLTQAQYEDQRGMGIERRQSL